MRLEAHANTVVAVAFSPDGRRLATGAADNTIRIREAFPWLPEEYQGGAQMSSAEKVEGFKRHYWQKRLLSPAWKLPLGTPPMQPGRRVETSMYGEVNLPTEPGTKKPAMPIPVRDLKATANLVDLTERYNASLTETWQPVTGLLDLEVNLSSLATGVTNLAGVQFDVRGLIRLGGTFDGSVFPAAVEIPVGRQFRQLHVLHGATTTTMDGTQVGTYRLHYRDGGDDADLSILYGRDVLDWQAPTPAGNRLRSRQPRRRNWRGLAQPSGSKPAITRCACSSGCTKTLRPNAK